MRSTMAVLSLGDCYQTKPVLLLPGPTRFPRESVRHFSEGNPMVAVCALLSYVDPGVGSLLLQALVGGSAGAVVLGRYVWQTYITPWAMRRL